MHFKYLIILVFFISSCQENHLEKPQGTYPLIIPKGFEKPKFPEDNLPTQSRIALGKKLFSEKALSLDSSIACISCHIPKKAFSDNKALSLGIKNHKGKRNSPTLVNLAYVDFFFADGGVETLESQAIAPITDELEMGLPNIEIAIKRLNQNPEYTKKFQEAYQTKPNLTSLTKALACFERTLLSGESWFDKFLNEGNKSLLSEAEIEGKVLFFSDSLACGSCHAGFLFTNLHFENNGLYKQYADQGRRRVTLRIQDDAKFKVPTLRNIALTPPYMHDGSFQTLEEVIDHYAKGGQKHPNQSPEIKGFTISKNQKINLIAFLKTLTDQSFILSQN